MRSLEVILWFARVSWFGFHDTANTANTAFAVSRKNAVSHRKHRIYI